MKVPSIFIRDDDMWTRDEAFLELLDFLGKHRVPVIYGVIPSRLEAGMARILRRAKEKTPGLLDIVQHGYSHENYASPTEEKYEFGPNRTYAHQFRDIEQGIRIMRRHFGRSWTPGFIPPYYGYDQSTLRVLRVLNVPLFSSRKKAPVLKKTFLDLPARVALNDYGRDSAPLAFDLRTMLIRTAKSLAPGRVAGAVYHHRAIRTRSDMRAIKAFLRHIARLRDEGKLKVALFSELLRSKEDR